MTPPAEPRRVSAFMNLAKPSTTKEPLMVSTRSEGSIRTATNATARSARAMMFMPSPERSPRMAPYRTRISAPPARRISGSAGPKAGMSRAGFIVTSVCGDRCRFHGCERGLVALHERIRRNREGVEDGAGLHAVIDDEQNERRESDDLAAVQVGDPLEGGLIQRPVDDPAVEPERVGRR